MKKIRIWLWNLLNNPLDLLLLGKITTPPCDPVTINFVAHRYGGLNSMCLAFPDTKIQLDTLMKLNMDYGWKQNFDPSVVKYGNLKEAARMCVKCCFEERVKDKIQYQSFSSKEDNDTYVEKYKKEMSDTLDIIEKIAV